LENLPVNTWTRESAIASQLLSIAVAGILAAGLIMAAGSAALAQRAESEHPRRNLVIFVADGLRHGSVNATDSPTLFRIQEQGVNFSNSHSLFPTFTTANASAIATGHYLGDTGDFSNSIYVGYPVFLTGNFGNKPGSVTPFIEDDQVLGDLDAHFNGNYLNEETLLAAARAQGYHTASIGKAGPAGIQDVTQLNPEAGKFVPPATIIIDDATGSANGVPLTPEVSAALNRAGLPAATPKRNQLAGTNTTPGTNVSNAQQQTYFANAATKAILPLFKQSGKPFVLLYWSRDPDGTQHNQGDSLNSLSPGINGPTSLRGLRDADDNLRQILNFIEGDADLAQNTDIFVTSDHGFATVSRHEIDAQGSVTSSYSAQWTYRDSSGRQEVNRGFLPSGFLAIDLAHFLGLPLFNPDSQLESPAGQTIYEPVDPTIGRPQATIQQHPATGVGLVGSGNGLIGGTGRVLERTDAQVIVAGNGGSDLLYVPGNNRQLVEKIVAFLAQQDYVGGLFVNDRFGKIAGALPLSAIGLIGSSQVPTPSIVVAFKAFAASSAKPEMTEIQVADTSLQEGQGMHGGLGRGSTFNFMAALGPDFKKGFVDDSPASNADITPTLANILHLHLPSNGQLVGRVLSEALTGGPSSVASRHHVAVSKKTAGGKATILIYQLAERQLYFDEACFSEIAKTPHQCPSP